MHPILFKLGPLTLRSFGLMAALGFLAGWGVLSRELRRKGLYSEWSYPIVTGAILGGILGAKIYYLVEHWRDVVAAPVELIFSGAGLVWYGGLAGGTLGVLWVIRRRHAPLGAVVDALAPALALGYVFGRMGCFLNGDDYGKPTRVPWALSFPEGTPPTTELVHPTQLYEILITLGIFALLWTLRRRLHPDGWLLWVYLILAGVERLIVEVWRVTTPLWDGVSIAQALSLTIVLTGLLALMALRRRRVH